MEDSRIIVKYFWKAYFYNDNFTPLSQIFVGTDRVAADQFTYTVDINPIFKQVVLDLDPGDDRIAGQIDSEAIKQEIADSIPGAEGLFIGFEFIKDRQTLEPDTELANHVKNELRNRLILTGTDGPFDNVIKSKPPLCFTRENVNEVIYNLESILKTNF